jgi:hypothetical protein
MWQVNGVRGSGELPRIANLSKGNLIILGSACGVWEDYEKARKTARQFDVMIINFTSLFYTKAISHLVSLHHDFLSPLREIRQKVFSSLPHFHTHSNHPDKEVDFVWQFDDYSGSSGLFATRIALALGYNKIILCGIPITNGRNFYHPLDYVNPLGDRANILSWQKANQEIFKNRVKSMSGNTKIWLGEPTEKWISN